MYSYFLRGVYNRDKFSLSFDFRVTLTIAKSITVNVSTSNLSIPLDSPQKGSYSCNFKRFKNIAHLTILHFVDVVMRNLPLNRLVQPAKCFRRFFLVNNVSVIHDDIPFSGFIAGCHVLKANETVLHRASFCSFKGTNNHPH